MSISDATCIADTVHLRCLMNISFRHKCQTKNATQHVKINPPKIMMAGANQLCPLITPKTSAFSLFESAFCAFVSSEEEPESSEEPESDLLDDFAFFFFVGLDVGLVRLDVGLDDGLDVGDAD